MRVETVQMFLDSNGMYFFLFLKIKYQKSLTRRMLYSGLRAFEVT